MSVPLALTLDCANCERSGCDSLGDRAPTAGTGVAGIVATSSDVSDNGCSECPFGETTLEIWNTDALIFTRMEADALLAECDADFVGTVTGRYDKKLAPGAYLLCVRPSCVGLVIEPEETVTVNIKLRFGPTSFFVGHFGEELLEENFGLGVETE